MTGSSPPAGKTPRAGGNPWSSADPAAKWWRGDGDSPAPARTVPPAYGGDEDEDPDLPVGAAPDDEPEPDRYDEPTVDVLAEQAEAEAKTGEGPAETGKAEPGTEATEPGTEATEAGTGATEPGTEEAEAKVGTAATRADGPRLAELGEAPHPEVGSERVAGYPNDQERPGAIPAASPSADTRDGVPDQAVPAVEASAGRPAVAVPEVMILPEPNRDRRERQTVALPRGPVPGQSRPGQITAEQPQTGQSKLETSTFWLLGEETDESRVRDGAVWPPAQGRGPAGPASRIGVPPRRRDLPRPPRRPVTGLLGLLVLGLAAMFFAWVSAGPFWLAVGHGDRGTATVTRCTGDGFDQRCVGQFTADRGSFTVPEVALMGVAADQRDQGAVVPARMVDRQARQAYVGTAPLLLHLRWALGVLLMLLSGLGIAALTGARRLETVRARRGAVLLSVAGPVALWAGFLAITY